MKETKKFVFSVIQKRDGIRLTEKELAEEIQDMKIQFSELWSAVTITPLRCSDNLCFWSLVTISSRYILTARVFQERAGSLSRFWKFFEENEGMERLKKINERVAGRNQVHKKESREIEIEALSKVLDGDSGKTKGEAVAAWCRVRKEDFSELSVKKAQASTRRTRDFKDSIN